MKYILFSIVSVIFIYSCTHQQIEPKASRQAEATFIKSDTIKRDAKFIDTLFELTETIAKETLYKYFKTEGFLLQPEIEGHSNILDLPKNKRKNVIEFVQLFLFNNGHSGIVDYYNTKPFQVGNCFQPFHAIVKQGSNGFIIVDISFIGPNITIDSVANNCVYGCYYNCKVRLKGKAFKLQLQ